ncbi:hypothetical protein [Salinimicrobium soli]|uniref:hypothetical protein n=1 Tax=Salinimicrobium soli TaxID=1254399 RepID=UPI003AAFE4FD
MKNIKILLFSASILLFSCSTDSNDDPSDGKSATASSCVMELADPNCTIAFLEAKDGEWTKIFKSGENANPLFLYANGETGNPLGTVTLSMNNGIPQVRINDSDLDDVLVRISQDEAGVKSECKVVENIPEPASEDAPDVDIKFSKTYTFPLYLQVEANVCP